MSRASCFGVIKSHALDWLIAFGFFAAGGIVQTFVPNDRAFVIEESISQKTVDDQKVPSLTLMVVTFPLPAIVFLAVAYLSKRAGVKHYLRELHHVFLGYLLGIGMQIMFQGFGTIYVGGLRPNFLDVCIPRIDNFQPCFANSTFLCGNTKDLDNLCWTTDKTQLDSARRSFFSGHASLAMVCYLYYALYAAGRLRMFHDTPIPLWKFCICFLPVFGAILIGFSRVVDNKHHPWEVFFGFVDGAVFAILSYRWYFHNPFGPLAGIPKGYYGYNMNNEIKAKSEDEPSITVKTHTTSSV